MTQATKTVIVDSAETAIEIFEKVGCPSVAEFIRWLQKEEQKYLVHVGTSIGLFTRLSLGQEKRSVNGRIITITPLESMLTLAQGIALNMNTENLSKEALKELNEIFEELMEINKLIEKGEFLDQGDVF